ncbi:SRPBCC family protein [Arthrobacter sp. CDRTa11]|uniref:SRPBCC family protein n=1 Tax=Arthrobacter sp. CDRTa11 TaxID=2651199 RepID=UPI002265F2F7|nr:SRPBCC family protein [Arthrobacter sp. CDRTa11]UZX04816.1 SRPBCC family protein [Arthrobacter sp. CDRTa11]
MSTKVEKRIVVEVPVSTAYNQWTQFEDFPHFMGGVESVRQVGDDRLKWVARIAGVRREWEARILEQVPDRKIAWASTGGATNAGAVEFEDAGGGKTAIALTLDYQPEGVVEKVGDLLHVVARQAEADLKKFKEFIEHEGHASGAWRGTVHGGKVGSGINDAGADAGIGAGAGGAGTTAAGTTAAGTTAAGPGVAGPAGVDQPEHNRFAHPFDQTNGLVDVEGESDETADGELRSAAQRREDEQRGRGFIPPPTGGTTGQF